MNCLEELWKHYPKSDDFYDEVARTAKRMVSTRCPKESEDLSQQTVLAVFKTIGKFDATKGSIVTFVRLTSDSIVNRYLKHQYDKPTCQIEDMDSFTFPEDGDQSYEKLAERFGEDKDVLDLLIQGYRLVEIEQMLGLSRKALRWKIDRIKD